MHTVRVKIFPERCKAELSWRIFLRHEQTSHTKPQTVEWVCGQDFHFFSRCRGNTLKLLFRDGRAHGTVQNTSTKNHSLEIHPGLLMRFIPFKLSSMTFLTFETVLYVCLCVYVCVCLLFYPDSGLCSSSTVTFEVYSASRSTRPV